MRQEDTATDVAIASPVSSVVRANFIDTTRSMIAGASGTSTDVGGAITYGLLFWALRLLDAGRAGLNRTRDTASWIGPISDDLQPTGSTCRSRL
jgi:hypothetical protein